MDCIHPIILKTGPVPCGRCLACLSNKRQQWAFRLSNENRFSKISYFITLTYDDEHLPMCRGHPSVSKRDIQLFLKRLRKLIYPATIRYFICSEYGPKTFRPHYHGIIFCSSENCECAEAISRAWRMGFVQIGTVSEASISYVAKYCVSEAMLPKYLCLKDVKPFTLSSRRPGIGFNYLTESMVNYYRSNMQSFAVRENGIKVALPRYYKDKLYSNEERSFISFQSASFRREQLERYNSKYEDYDRNSDIYTDPMSYQQKVAYERRVKNLIIKKSKL
nr:MAG: replication initiation protein [Microviridae sp.]